MKKFKNIFNWKSNPVISSLLAANILSNSGWAFVSPILAIYVVNNIEGGTIQVIGICYFIYWMVKSILQLFISRSLDSVKGEGDDYVVLLLGQFFDVLVPLGFLFAHTPAELYLIYLIYGIGDALYVPPWNAIFTRHVDPERVSSQWSLDSTGFGFGAALAVVIGSSLAVALGFRTVFILVAAAEIIALVIISKMRPYFAGKEKKPIKYLFPLQK